MTYDSKTGTINLEHGSDFLADSGAHFINMLRDLAQDPSANSSIKNDWSTVEAWLGCVGRDLTPQDNDKIGRAWRAYYAVGVAPSHELQPAFDAFSKQYKSSGQYNPADKPPTAVMDAFDRMLATDEEIKEKKAFDRSEKNPEIKALADAIRALKESSHPATSQLSWWRRQSQEFRSWAFISLAWAAASFFYITVFDPFELGGWEYADGQDYLKALSIVVAPAIFGIAKKAYDHAVK